MIQGQPLTTAFTDIVSNGRFIPLQRMLSRPRRELLAKEAENQSFRDSLDYLAVQL